MMTKLLFILLQLTWGLPQNMLGLLLFCLFVRRPHCIRRCAVVTRWRLSSSLSMGLFIFLSEKADKTVFVHEYGHTVQSALLGPLFLPLVGVSSSLWAARYRRLVRRGCWNGYYYAFLPERTANLLGEHVTGEKAPRPFNPHY